jgi:hypothetical protein
VITAILAAQNDVITAILAAQNDVITAILAAQNIQEGGWDPVTVWTGAEISPPLRDSIPGPSIP